LEALGYGAFDALHLACAEQGLVDVLLTTDGPMIPLEQMTDEQFEQHALTILHRELGVYGLARFLRAYRACTGNYTRVRHQWLNGLTIQELAQEF
jgi:hypothetical protein